MSWLNDLFGSKKKCCCCSSIEVLPEVQVQAATREAAESLRARLERVTQNVGLEVDFVVVVRPEEDEALFYEGRLILEHPGAVQDERCASVLREVLG